MITVFHSGRGKSAIAALGMVILGIVPIACTGWATAHAAVSQPTRTIDSAFFGMHIHALVTPNKRTRRLTQWPDAPLGFVRLWDMGGTRWFDVQPSPDVWRFELADAAVDQAQAHGAEVVYTLGPTPRWASARPDEPSPYGFGTSAEPADLESWKQYVSKLVKRYRGRVKYYELWNEPYFDGPGKKAYYTGSVETMVEMARLAQAILRENDPGAKLVSPGFTHEPKLYLEKFLRAGGGAFCDVIAFHFYSSTPEKSFDKIRLVRELLGRFNMSDKPLWNTEQGYEIAPADQPVPGAGGFGVRDLATLAAYVPRTLVLGAAAGLSRVAWYSWDPSPMGLFDDDAGQVNAAGRAYITSLRWLAGTTVSDCGPLSGKLWKCTLSRGSRTAYMLWRADNEPQGFLPPSDWRVVSIESLGSPEAELKGGNAVSASGSPVLLKTDRFPWGPF